MTDLFSTPFGNFHIRSNTDAHPATGRAWNQADAYLLNTLHATYGTALADQKLAIVNDQFGALTCALASFEIEIFSDSAIFKRWLQVNLGATEPTIRPIDDLSQSSADIYLVKLPKHLHFFQCILSTLSCIEHATVYVAGMQRHWPRSFFETAHDYFSDVKVFPGVKKAKCMQLKGGLQNPEPSATQIVDLPDFGLSCVNFPNVFSREKLDIGTRFFLDSFPNLSTSKRILDLGCGNGILGMQALMLYPESEVTFIDESYYAIQSCKASLIRQQIDLNRVQFYQNDCCFGLDVSPCDTVLCNPPFHQHHQIGTQITRVMIEHAYHALQEDGRLFLIGNRHLQYHKLLQRYFDHVKPYRENSKFIMYQANKLPT